MGFKQLPCDSQWSQDGLKPSFLYTPSMPWNNQGKSCKNWKSYRCWSICSYCWICKQVVLKLWLIKAVNSNIERQAESTEAVKPAINPYCYSWLCIFVLIWLSVLKLLLWGFFSSITALPHFPLWCLLNQFVSEAECVCVCNLTHTHSHSTITNVLMISSPWGPDHISPN